MLFYMELIIELFLLFIIIGIALMYVLAEKPQVLIKLPNDKTVYIDEKNVCYKYEKEYI
jgi:hypothetical protein